MMSYSTLKLLSIYEGLIDREPNDQGNNIVNILVNTIVLYNINNSNKGVCACV